MTAIIREEKNNDDDKKESAQFIPRDRAGCEECRNLLRETTLSVVMSNVGHHSSGFVRFEDEEKERTYENHLLSVHGLAR